MPEKLKHYAFKPNLCLSMICQLEEEKIHRDIDVAELNLKLRYPIKIFSPFSK